MKKEGKKMEPWAIIKIVMMIVGGMVVLDHTPGIDVFKDDRADYKALVKCEAKMQGLARKSQELVREFRVILNERKDERGKNRKLEKQNRKLEKQNRKLEKNLDDVRNRRRDGGGKRLRGREDRGSGDKNGFWDRIFPRR